MSVKRLTIDGYGQLELNNVAFRRDGRIEAQCALDATDFATIPAENGMLLAVDKVNNVVKLPVDASLPIALVYTSEHQYDERKPGLKDFALFRGSFYPRLGYLSIGETFTENCIAYDTDDFADDNTLKAATSKTALNSTPLYGGYCSNGAILVSDTKPSDGPVLKVVKGYTMPDGQFGIKFQVVEA